MFFDSPKKENKNNDIKNTLYSEDKKYNTEKKNKSILRHNKRKSLPNNLIDEIINQRKNIAQNSYNFFKLSENDNKNKNNSTAKPLSMPKLQNTKSSFKSSNNDKINTTSKNTNYLKHSETKVEFKNIQTKNSTKSSSTKEFKSKKNNKVSFGASLNQILINNIQNAIVKKGIIIDKIKRKNLSSIIYKSRYSDKNLIEMHKKIFDKKLIELYQDYEKRMGYYRKQRIAKLMPTFEEIRRENELKIPIYIKGYNKKNLDIFYTRNVCDLDYQNYYNRDQINLNDILQNHNKYNRKDYLSGNVPFFMLTKSVFKPKFRKSVMINNKDIKKISL